jgi:hypothetical protein
MFVALLISSFRNVQAEDGRSWLLGTKCAAAAADEEAAEGTGREEEEEEDEDEDEETGAT